ncbi:MAG: threonine--tRNA ligase [Calditrichaeota bacterium]|nr:MAG: threonine--tRNA ligase [Calditrichota bacterium]
MQKKELIDITFPDGSQKSYPKGVTPEEIAKNISPALAQKAVAAKVNDRLVDLNRPILSDARLEILTYDSPEGMKVFWHSTSHIMAHAVKNLFPEAQFGVGPAIENGFYYDIDIDAKLSPEDLARIEEEMRRIVQAGETFQREELTKEEAIALFREKRDRYKLELLQDMEDQNPSIYWEGNFVDLCRGPHIPKTSMVKAFKLLSIAGAYWRGDEKNKMLQRIYGISFPKKSQLDEFLRYLEEAKKRDHRRLGRELDLFSFQPEGPGFVFWHPQGMRIYLVIESYLRQKLSRYDYEEVKTPMVLNSSLWKKSGHWDNYKDNMYFINIDDETYAIKPMNCPGACLIYRNSLKSYRELPIRLAEFGNVHRHERSGVLNGLFRVRQFTQDDAHIFCMPEQILDEVLGCIRLVLEVYQDFKLTDFHVELSTRPEKSIGSDELWQKAEQSLEEALKAANMEYQLNPGDGAFYGPKIDFHVRDSLRRSWQLGTIQLDFSMPERFELEYVGSDGSRHRPVMIHRAIFGSIERFIAQLVEHYAGAFPAWLAPTQVTILPITDHQIEYANQIYQELRKAGFRVKLDDRNEKIGYKIREAETQKVPYMLVVGAQEVEQSQVAVRKHKKGDQGKMSLEQFIHQLSEEIEHKN